MVRSQYASTKTPPAPTLNAIAGNISTAATYSVWLYCRNRAGVTVKSDRAEIAISSGGIEIVLPSSIKASASEIVEIGVVLNIDNTDSSSGCVVATYPGDLALPAQIFVETEEQIKLNATVSDESLLPSVNLLHGMRRYVDSLGQIQRWNATGNIWEVFYPQTFNPLVSSNLDEGGADAEVSKILDTSRFIIPDYEGDGSPSEGVTFWIVNDSNVDIDAGTRVRLSATIAAIDLISEDFAGLLEVEFLGYVDIATAEIDTSGMAVGGTIPYNGLELPTLFLPKALPPNYGYVLRVNCNFENFALGNAVLQGSILRLYPYLAPYKSTYDSNGNFLGDHIRAEGDRRRIVPDGVGLNAIALGGAGTVKSFQFPPLGEQAVPGLELNKAGQKVAITNNGTCYVTETIPATAALRAIVSTEDGEGLFPSTYESVTLSSSEVLELTLTAPTKIRDDYPDSVARTIATLNANKVRVYLSPTGTNNWSYWEETFADSPDTITVGTSAGISVGAKIAGTDLSFGLFSPEYARATVAGVSTLNGTYDLAVVYVYTNTITRISHSANDGCINEDLVPYGELVTAVTGTINAWGRRINNENQLNSLTVATGLGDYKTYPVGYDQYFQYDPDETRGDNRLYFKLIDEPGAMIRRSLPYQLNTDLTFYVSAVGDNNANGQSISTPTTWSEMRSKLDKIALNGKIITVKCVDNSSFLDDLTLPDCGDTGKIVITTQLGNTRATFNSLKLDRVTSEIEITDIYFNDNIAIANCPKVTLTNVKSFNATPTEPAYLFDLADVKLLGDIESDGDCPSLFKLRSLSRVDASGTNDIEILGDPIITNAIDIDDNSILDLGANTVGGSFTGSKFAIAQGFVRCTNNLDEQIIGGTTGTVSSKIGYSTNTVQARKTYSVASTSINVDAEQDITLELDSPNFILYKITTDFAARVRGYQTVAAKTADASRDESTLPSSSAGVIFDVITEDDGNGVYVQQLLAPIVSANNETSPLPQIPLLVKNKDTAARIIAVDIEALAIANL